MRFPAVPGWGPLIAVVGGPSPLLAEVFWCGSLPILAGVRCRCWLVIPCHSWLRARVRFPAPPGWGPLVVVVGGPSPLHAEGPGCGSPPLLVRVR